MKKIWNKIHSRLDYRIRSLSPKRIVSRFNGPTVMANSIPRSGTHVLTKCLTMFPQLSYSGLHYTYGKIELATLESYLRRTGRGRFMAAHLNWSEECAQLLENRSVRTILSIRDPRDVMVSNIFFTLGKKSLKWHDYFASLPNMDSRIRTLIEGVDVGEGESRMFLTSIRGHFEHYLPWVEQSGGLLVRFEDLIGPGGGGDEDKQNNTIRAIAKHLDQRLDEEEVSHIAKNIFSTKSVTFRKGSIGGWREHFSKENSDLFDSLHGKFFSELGYELGE